MSFYNITQARIINLKDWEEIEKYNRGESDITDYFAWGASIHLGSPAYVRIFRRKLQIDDKAIAFAYLVIVSLPRNKEEMKKEIEEFVHHQESLLYPAPIGLVPTCFFGKFVDEKNLNLFFIITAKELFGFFCRSNVSFN